MPEFWRFDDAPHMHSVSEKGSEKVEELVEHKKKSVVSFNTFLSCLDHRPTL